MSGSIRRVLFGPVAVAFVLFLAERGIENPSIDPSTWCPDAKDEATKLDALAGDAGADVEMHMQIDGSEVGDESVSWGTRLAPPAGREQATSSGRTAVARLGEIVQRAADKLADG